VQQLDFTIKMIASVKWQNNKLGQTGIKKPPQLMFEVVGVGTVRKLNS
jgi:hypothetical protein